MVEMTLHRVTKVELERYVHEETSDCGKYHMLKLHLLNDDVQTTINCFSETHIELGVKT